MNGKDKAASSSGSRRPMDSTGVQKSDRRTPEKSGLRLARDEQFLGGRIRKSAPYEFVLEALAEMEPRTNPMFGCLAVYVGEKILLVLRDRPKYPKDNGVWLATTIEHHESLRKEFPHMRSVGLLGKKITGWQVLAADTPDFEQAALRACELVLAKDPRIGKVPKGKSKSSARRKKQGRK